MSKDKLNISPADIDALKAPDVLHSYCRAALGEGKKKGRLTFYRCPWGTHSRPKLEVTERDGIGVAMCRACNTGGTVFDVAAGVLGLHVKRDFPAVVKAVADAVGYPLRDSTEEPPKKGRRTRKKSRSCCSAVVTKAAPVPPVEEPLEFLPQNEEAAALDAVHRLAGDADAQARFADLLGLPLDVVRFHTDIQESGALGLLGLDERGRLLYVYTHCPAAGEPPRVVGVKTRNPQGVEPRFLMHGRKRDMWGIEAAADARLVIITEGESDALAGRSAFWTWFDDWARNAPETYPDDALPAVVSKPDAGTFKESWARKLKGKEVILIVDNDDAGRKGAEKTASMLHAAGVRRVFSWTPPDGFKDARAALDAARPWMLADDIMENRKEVIL